jgi:hypothetical protein
VLAVVVLAVLEYGALTLSGPAHWIFGKMSWMVAGQMVLAAVVCGASARFAGGFDKQLPGLARQSWSALSGIPATLAAMVGCRLLGVDEFVSVAAVGLAFPLIATIVNGVLCFSSPMRLRRRGLSLRSC